MQKNFSNGTAQLKEWVFANIRKLMCVYIYIYIYIYGFPSGSVVKNLPAKQEMGLIPGLGHPLEKEMAIHFSILAWKIPWTEEPGGLQSIESQRVGHD